MLTIYIVPQSYFWKLMNLFETLIVLLGEEDNPFPNILIEIIKYLFGINSSIFSYKTFITLMSTCIKCWQNNYI